MRVHTAPLLHPDPDRLPQTAGSDPVELVSLIRPLERVGYFMNVEGGVGP